MESNLMKIEVFSEGQLMSRESHDACLTLFTDNYHNYHYMDQIGQNERVRILAVLDNKIIGYASFIRRGNYAFCGNLLVSRDYQSSGIGSRLEVARHAEIVKRCINVYVSCVCETLWSQNLKLKLGLTPKCIKIGYRKAVSGAGRLGSSVVFSNFKNQPKNVVSEAQVFDAARLRLRIIGSDLNRLRSVSLEYPSAYIEVLCGRLTAEVLIDDPGFIFGGIDYHAESTSWHYCFQRINEVYEAGLKESPLTCITRKELLRQYNF
jgi:hypothetical protein